MLKKYSNYSLFIVMVGLMLTPQKAFSYTANQVSFEFLGNGTYRVNLFYTVPALREFREASIQFQNRRQAEKFYFDVVQGGDFYINSKGAVDFKNNNLKPSPW